MTSVWLDQGDPRSAAAPSADAPPGDLSDEVLDDLVVGAGLTGMTAAVLLARAGRGVAVVEARSLGAVTTGHTTGKVSLLQGTKLSRILSRHPRRVAEAYLESNRDGQVWLLEYCAEHDVAFQVRDSVTYASSTAQNKKVDQEFRAARSLGLPMTQVDHLDVPFPHERATVLRDQAQLDAVQVLRALRTELTALGGTLHEGRRVTGVSRRSPLRVELDSQQVVLAHNVVLATGAPVLDRGGHFGQVEPTRSYVLTVSVPDATSAMYLSAGSPTRSVRDVPTPHGNLIMVGGNGHPVGRGPSELGQLEDLRAWTAEYWPGAAETHAWSAQDYSPFDELPLVGRMPLTGGHVSYATGYDKWGMTNSVAAALSITGHLLGQPPAWDRTLHGRSTGLRDLGSIAVLNAGVGAAALRSFARAESRSTDPEPAEGRGRVGRGSGVPTATATVDGTTCRLLAVCTHLGGTLRWNDAERSWDCPLHGSRFAADGRVLEGPATRRLQVAPSAEKASRPATDG